MMTNRHFAEFFRINAVACGLNGRQQDRHGISLPGRRGLGKRNYRDETFKKF